MSVLRRDAAALDLAPALEAFAREGWARVGVALDEDAAAALRARAQELMDGRVSYPGLFFQHDSATGRYGDLVFGAGWQGPSPDYRKIEKLELDPLFRAWLGNPLFARLARALVGNAVALYRAVLFTKSAGGGSELPWHQDAGDFWGIDRDPTLQIWTALDDAPADAGCVEVLPGSHREGRATRQGGVIPDARLAGAERGALALPARAGEVLLLHNHLWHRSGVNRTGRPRRAFSVCFVPAATRCLRRRGAPREFPLIFA